MHNVWTRLNAVVFFSLTILLILAVLAWLSTILAPHDPAVHSVQLNALRSLRKHGGLDRALLSFDVHADLSGAFNWNITVARGRGRTKLPAHPLRKAQAAIVTASAESGYLSVTNHLKALWPLIKWTGR